MDDNLARQITAMLSQKLLEHLSLLEIISEMARNAAAIQSREDIASLAGYLENLRSVMSSMVSDVEALLSALKSGVVAKDTAREIYALAGYYVEAGSKTEAEVEGLLRSIMGDPGFDPQLREAFRRLYLLAEKVYRE